MAEERSTAEEAPKAPASGIERAAGLGAISSIASLLAGIVRAKIVASVLGPAALGISSEISQLVSLVNTGSATFAGPGLIRAVAAAEKEKSTEKIERALGSALLLTLVTSLFAGAIAVLISDWVLPDAAASIARPLLMYACLGTAMSVSVFALTQTSTASGHIRDATITNLVLSLLGAISAALLTWWFGMTGQFASYLVAPLAVAPLALVLLRRSGAVRTRLPRLRFDADFAREGLKLGGASLLGGLFSQLALSTIRVVLEKTHGNAEWNGQFQAAWALGVAYLAVILSGVGSYVFPRYSVVTEQELPGEIASAGAFVMKIAPPIVMMAISLREVALVALYDHRFLEASEILGLQFSADIVRSLSWVYSGPLLYRNKPRAFLVVEFLANLVTGLGAVIFVPMFGLKGVGLAYLSSCLSYVLMTWLACRTVFSIKLPFTPVLRALGLTAAALALNQWLPRVWWAGALVVVGALGWMWVNGALKTLLGTVMRKLRRTAPAKV